MTIQVTPDTEVLIADAVAQGLSSSASALVETAVREYLESQRRRLPNRLRELRRQIEQAGIPLLDEDGLAKEIAERRGSCE